MAKIICVSVGCADTTVVQTPDGTVLVDCYRGDEYGQASDAFEKYLPSSKHLKAVFITHQHADHFRGLRYLVEGGYTVEYLVFSPYERRSGDNSVELSEWNEFLEYKEHFRLSGTKLYYPFRQDNWTKPWWETCGIRMWMLGPAAHIAKQDTREIHDACLVMHFGFRQGSCVFTGDASDTLLQWVAENTTFGGDMLHASHHGSLNGACLDFIKKAHPRYTVISTKSGVHENVPDATALTRYKNHTGEAVYRTDEPGTWTFTR